MALAETLAETLVRRPWAMLARAWAAIQVERHGSYSVERMQQLQQYQQSTSRLHAWVVVILTPLPCLAAATLLDMIPIEPPSLGLAHSQLFWIRASVICWTVNLAVLVQLREIVAQLTVTIAQVIWISLVVTVVGVAFMVTLSSQVGFPLPFVIVLNSPGECLAFAVCFFLVWGKILREQREVRRDVVQYYVLVIKQVSLIYIYGVFSYAFTNAGVRAQSGLALLLPVLKLAVKNLINSSAQQVEDLKPEMIIFNIEIFHALYVSISMQTAASTTTITLLMTIDFLHADEETRMLNSLTPSERRERVISVLQLLHLTEFVLLVEYTEVMIPVVYCLYLAVLSRLPVRVYYAQLHDMDDAKLQRTICNILLYALLELASFLVLSKLVGKRLGVSSVHQLAFVLERQWQMVQAKLVLWVIITLQSPLEHFGADYSFHFEWLRGSGGK